MSLASQDRWEEDGSDSELLRRAAFRLSVNTEAELRGKCHLTKGIRIQQQACEVAEMDSRARFGRDSKMGFILGRMLT